MNNGSIQAFRILRFAFAVAPIIAAVDKFLHLLTNWDKYLPLSSRIRLESPRIPS